MFDRLLHNYRKEWLQDKHIESCKKVNQEDLSVCNEQLNNNQNNLSGEQIAYIYKRKIETLIYLNKFQEALECANEIFWDSLYFKCSSQMEYLCEIYFYRGFIKVCLKDYKGALEDYDKANQLGYIGKEWLFRHRVCYEIEITNKKIYGVTEGCKKTAEYFSNMFQYHPDDFVALYYCARANYFVDAEKSLQNYKMLLEDSLLKTEDRPFPSTRKMLRIYWFLAIIKCNISIWKTKNIQNYDEIIKYFNQADKELHSNKFGNKEDLQIFLNHFKFVLYKLTNKNQKAEEYKTKAIKIFKMELFSSQCAFYSDQELDKVIKTKNISEEEYRYAFYDMFYNTNASFEFFKYFYNKCNMNISDEDIKDFMCGLDEEELEERLKYLIEKV
jgi:tetratricopeptide (TPR) repeat protein